ncbi:alpha/beta hydrolase family protein [Actinokineospora terrae]|uniref:Alpha/beta hydrolase family protein n=1 Tax=Actinokineospora terrae TaxID=155974 RepID=A0A1H9TAK1_9PSEU|nr:lipase [Actinokineospora terrae]SER93799.1 Alpha/beta hydrolase family protein [Actinokineospora terrae]
MRFSRSAAVVPLAASLLLGTGAVATASPVVLTLPPPTGPRPVGTAALHLVDHQRVDPWGAPGSPRELMISLWYPARDTGRYPVAPWLPPAAAARYAIDNGVAPGDLRVPDTHGHDGAPIDRCGRLPVVLYSPGNDSFRSANTVVVEELASRGYLVVTIDHTHDGLVEFPGGRVSVPVPDGPATGEAMAAARVADVRFVLDQLTALDTGANPDVDGHPLPRGLRGGIDLARVGMFGYSAGATTTAATLHADPRVRAGIGVDGAVTGPVVTAGLDRPYLLMNARASRQTLPDLATFWSNLRGWKRDITLTGAAHATYGDLAVLLPQAAPLLGLNQAEVEAEIGTVAPARSVAVQQAYPTAFFDRHFRHTGHLVDGPSTRFPEVVFTP